MTAFETNDCFINGEFIAPANGLYLDNRNPATNQLTSRIARATRPDVDKAASAAKAALVGEWSEWSAARRSALLYKIADKIDEQFEALSQLESDDTGKPIRLTRKIDVPRAADNFRFFAGAMLHDETQSTEMADAWNLTQRSPMGVVGLITPWNLPLYLLTWKVAPALACGNTIVAKPSEMTPRTAHALAQILHECGLPRGVFNLVHGLGAEVGQAIVDHPEIRAISFTGGTASGRLVGATCGRLLKKVSLELGGKNPTIVFADADFDLAVAGAMRAAFTNQGQICLCGSRLFVEESIAERFTQALVDKVRAEITVGDPAHGQSWMGSLISQDHRNKVEFYVDLAQKEGGKILCGGKRPELSAPFSDGAFFEPTIVSGLSPTSRTATEEIFGPVVTIHTFKTESEVLTHCNALPYGLASSVWTTSLRRAQAIARKLDTGMVWVNCWLHRDLRVPFGGVKDSGIGREGGKHSLEFFSQLKNICLHWGNAKL